MEQTEVSGLVRRDDLKVWTLEPRLHQSLEDWTCQEQELAPKRNRQVEVGVTGTQELERRTLWTSARSAAATIQLCVLIDPAVRWAAVAVGACRDPNQKYRGPEADVAVVNLAVHEAPGLLWRRHSLFEVKLPFSRKQSDIIWQVPVRTPTRQSKLRRKADLISSRKHRLNRTLCRLTGWTREAQRRRLLFGQ